MPSAPEPAQPRDAAAVVMFRRAGEGVEVFWVRRGAQLSFAAGFYAFPGGAVDSGDAAIPVSGVAGAEAAFRVAAARELFEETGVLRAEGAQKLPSSELAHLRRQLLEGEASFAEILSKHGLRLAAHHFQAAGRWITPPFMPTRFDARFFLLEMPAWAEAELWPGEHAEAGWIRPADALKRWEEGTALLHPPNLHAIQTLARYAREDEIAAQLCAPPYCKEYVVERIEFQRGIRIFPLRTPTLPPATHTNCYLLGNGELVIVDPGAADPDEVERLLSFVAGLQADGFSPTAIFLTHHHLDHIGGAAAIAQRLQIPVWCHERTADRLPFRAGRLFSDAQVLELKGSPPMRFTVLHTPGHARGHLCLVEERSRAAIVGDMVAGLGTIVIDPPEGDMGDYLAQLRRLKELPVRALYPAHGPVIPDGPPKLSEYLAHRQQREQMVLEAIRAGDGTVPDIVRRAYQDVPALVHPIAERSTQAILIKLLREGKLTLQGERYRA
jgi:glyoxylase-like metal-dependent hydrolase (beta-lactamase superfamily II)/8-oxo-dGTP pyrophosphatase MutT (NUDIX family)